ncbi:MAG: nucleoside/nucleotide kinase family protein [Sedimentitalea sp.]
MMRFEDVVAKVHAAPARGRRKLVALAGPPASGKSTLAKRLCAALGAQTALVEMDGFHLDNRQLDRLGLRAQKGAPDTFDVGGFTRLVAALQTEQDIYVPLFDRAQDCAIAGAGLVAQDCKIVVLEGNYLLFDAPGWRDLAPLWDVSVRLDPNDATLRARLLARWLAHGLSPADAQARADGNDMANAARIKAAALPATFAMSEEVI